MRAGLAAPGHLAGRGNSSVHEEQQDIAFHQSVLQHSSTGRNSYSRKHQRRLGSGMVAVFKTKGIISLLCMLEINKKKKQPGMKCPCSQGQSDRTLRRGGFRQQGRCEEPPIASRSWCCFAAEAQPAWSRCLPQGWKVRTIRKYVLLRWPYCKRRRPFEELQSLY